MKSSTFSYTVLVLALWLALAWWPAVNRAEDAAPAAKSNSAGEELPAPEFSEEQIAFYEEQILPLLTQHCLVCHGADERFSGGLRMTSRQAVLFGGDSGPAVELDAPEHSLLLSAVNYEAYEMPPSGKLADDKIALLARWVEMGLPWTPGEEDDFQPETYAIDWEEARQWWSYRPLERPEPARVAGADWVRNPVDQFVLARLEEAGLQPIGEADKVALCRRVYYGLTGLPPTPEQIDAFVEDDSPDAYERLVDRLLDSPHYGEKWGRHWLDLVSYAETHGYERDKPKPFAWRYRDYVIQSFNEDKPYNRFIVEQLAGDELDEVTKDSLIATGYYRLGIWDDEPADRLEARYDVLDHVISTTGQVFMGMTLGCARCHDHKKDPILQQDYYQFLAFFQDVSDMNAKNTRVFAATDAERKGDGGRSGVEIMCVEERGTRPTHLLIRGNAHAQGQAVQPRFPTILSDQDTVSIPELPSGINSSGKRRALAEWIASDDHPLTARVMMNRVWQHHFGRGIAPTTNDFGKLGEAPTHPELLDWLAAEFVDGGWTMKRMHKLLLMSNTYRMSSRADATSLAQDPTNELFWRQNMRRLTAEEIRDSILAVGGNLNLQMFGPSVYPPIPRAVLAGQSRPGSGWGSATPEQAARRSVYVHVKRSLILPILGNFDLADTDSSCAVRHSTTVPTQSLNMLNSDFTNEQARIFAERLQQESPGDVAAQVRRAIRLTAGRPARDEELRADLAFLERLQQEARLTPEQALAAYCLMMINTNEFLYLD